MKPAMSMFATAADYQRARDEWNAARITELEADNADLRHDIDRAMEANAGLATENTALLEVLQEVRHWFEAERKSISKGNGSPWSMWQCEEQMQAIDAAIAKAGAVAEEGER